MRLSYVLSAAVLLTTFGMAQTPCRQARASTVERQDGFAIYSLSLPLRDSAVTAQAVIPDGQHRLRAVVFSFSTLVASEPNRIVDMMPIAKDAARNGRAAIVLQRKLTWPTIAESVGNSQTAVMCAQQWLSAHANIKPDDWLFVGPESDVPTFEQLKGVGDSTSMTFRWGFAIGGPNDQKNTDNVLHAASLTLADFVPNTP